MTEQIAQTIMNTKTSPIINTLRLAKKNQKIVSYFEFWPMWVFYIPVAIQWLILAIRYRSLTLPLIANPKLTVSGMVGVPKSELMLQATGECKNSILSWDIHTVSKLAIEIQMDHWLEILKQKAINFPFVCKPDIGCRGAGVKLVHNRQQLLEVMKSYPIGATLMAQILASWEPEVGVFFVRQPGELQGNIVSLTQKHNPRVTGDGIHTLGELVEKDPRAKLLIAIYQQRHLKNWHNIIPLDSEYSLLFSSSHCRGAVFTDAREHITDDLNRRISKIMQGLPEFHYGRLDVKFKSLEDLKLGGHLEIIEINGASSESIHIWDKNATLIGAVKTLLWQYHTLFRIGFKNKKLGYKPPGVIKIISLWRKEQKLVKHYPLTD